MSLSPAELEHFHDTGYLVKPGVFTASDFDPLRAAITNIIDAATQELQEAGKLRDVCAAEPFETRLARIFDQGFQAGVHVHRAITGKGGGGYSGPAMFDLLRHPRLLSCIESLVGPDIVGSSIYRIRPKIPSGNWARGEVPWHQDSGYALAHCDRHLIVTCWIPLVPATVENGCLWVLPGRHQQGILRHYTGGHMGYLEIPEEELPEGDPVPIEMEVGGVLFMTNLTPHVSFANRTDHVRWSVDLRYQSAAAPNNVGEAPEDYTPEREPVTMACHPPEADFVIRDRQRPDLEVRTPAQFHQLRERFERARPHHPGRGWTPLAERMTAR